MKTAWDWFCNAVNGNLSGIPSPVAWGAVAVLIIAPVVKRLHSKLDLLHDKADHIIRHSRTTPPFGGQ